MYEQIRPCDPFGRIMQDHFLKLNSALQAVRRYPDTAAQRRRFLDEASVQRESTSCVTFRRVRHLKLNRTCVLVPIFRAGTSVCVWT